MEKLKYFIELDIGEVIAFNEYNVNKEKVVILNPEFKLIPKEIVKKYGLEPGDHRSYINEYMGAEAKKEINENLSEITTPMPNPCGLKIAFVKDLVQMAKDGHLLLMDAPFGVVTDPGRAPKWDILWQTFIHNNIIFGMRSIYKMRVTEEIIEEDGKETTYFAIHNGNKIKVSKNSFGLTSLEGIKSIDYLDFFAHNKIKNFEGET